MVESMYLELETVTPLFMYGADQNHPEIRAASIKGVMRWWWRAVVAEENIKKLRTGEIEIFGSINKKSSFFLSVDIIGKFNPIKYRLLPYGTKKFELPSIPPGYKFGVEIQSDSELKSAYNIFKLAILLGGFGKRSRRGSGSVTLNDWNFKNVDDIFKIIITLLNCFKDDFSSNGSSIIRKRNIDGGATPYPFITKITIGKPTYSAEELRVKIGEASHNHSNPSLGNGVPRMASPVYVSIVKISDKYAPVITELNSAFPPGYQRADIRKQMDFVKEVLK